MLFGRFEGTFGATGDKAAIVASRWACASLATVAHALVRDLDFFAADMLGCRAPQGSIAVVKQHLQSLLLILEAVPLGST